MLTEYAAYDTQMMRYFLRYIISDSDGEVKCIYSVGHPTHIPYSNITAEEHFEFVN